MSAPYVAILLSSDSDLAAMEPVLDVLMKFNVPWEVKVTSPHRAPETTASFVKEADKRGCQVFICAAGVGAHLAGAVAAWTVKPVIGVPLEAALNGLDALLATVQMPAGVPVATMAVGKPGPKNAAYLAVQMMALADPELAECLRAERAANAKAVQEKDAALQARLANRED